MTPARWPSFRFRHLFAERNEKGHGMEELLAATQHAGVIPKTRLDFKTMEPVTSDLDAFKLVRVGDFVISLRSFEGGLEYSAHQGILSPAYTVLAPTEHVEPEFFRYLLKSSEFVQSLAKHKKGIRDGQAVPFATLRDDYLRVPDSATQRRIATFLDEQTARIDALIAEKERLIATLAEYRQSWISELLRNPPDSMRVRLKFCLKSRLQYGATESGERDPVGPRYIRITDIAGDGTLREDDVKFLTPAQATGYELEDRDVLFARSGATVGKTFVYEASMGSAAFAGYLIRAQLRPDRLLPQYLRLLTDSHQYWEFIRGAETQSTIQNASAEKLANFEMNLPDVARQQSLLVGAQPRLQTIGELSAHAVAHLDRLREYRSSLISAAVTGQLALGDKSTSREERLAA